MILKLFSWNQIYRIPFLFKQLLLDQKHELRILAKTEKYIIWKKNCIIYTFIFRNTHWIHHTSQRHWNYGETNFEIVLWGQQSQHESHVAEGW